MLYEKFVECLENDDKPNAVRIALDALETGQVGIVELYTELLMPAQNKMELEEKRDSVAIWKEHFRTSVVRTVIECCYPRVVKEGLPNSFAKGKKKIVVFCPAEEYHDVGARMISDFFALCGHNVYFLGSNTPPEALLEAMMCLQPEVVAMGVSNYFNLVAAKRTLEEVRKILGNQVSIVLGGAAFKDNLTVVNEIGGDYYVDTYDAVVRLSEGWENHETGI
ncbi:MAG: cobalamin B12-binding domain-containing protein [Acetobacterium woodii]|nr:cobalamin B12-binding domain-containing protein [Acetobacterium woodii]